MAHSTITIDQWIALNEEIISLARAGVPLDSGLTALAREMPGRLQGLAQDFSQRLEAGATLTDVLGATGSFPPLYRAMVEAGIRTGNLAAALEGLSATLRRARELRRALWAGAVYPAMVLAAWYAFSIFFLLQLWPGMASARAYFEVAPNRGTAVLDWLRDTLPWWGPIIPAVLILCGFLGRLGAFRLRRDNPIATRLIPSATLATSGSLAVYTDLLALLIEHNVPLPEAIELSGRASGDRSLELDSQEFAKQLRGGENHPQGFSNVPGWIRWLLMAHLPSHQLVKALRQLSGSYHRRAEHAAQWFSIYLPVFISAGVGGMLVLIYALMALGPWYQLLWQISQNPG